MELSAVIGLGYVGLCLALQAKKVGLNVIGIEKRQDRVDLINVGTSPIKEPFAEKLKSQVSLSQQAPLSPSVHVSYYQLPLIIFDFHYCKIEPVP